jgi:two-component system, NarL family, nitrate/nitrite response regulator NarL
VSKCTLVIIVSPKVVLREGIASLLQDSRYKVVGCAAGPAELPPTCCPKGQQALAIVGVDRQNGDLDDAAESIRLLRTLMPDGKVVLVVETNGPIDLQRELALSPDACIFNLGSRDTLIKILELTFMDQRVFVLSGSMAIANDPAVKTVGYDDPNRGGALSTLSPRERQILVSVAEGRSNKAIARLYNLSEATVKVHLKAILRKTKTHNRTQAAIWAIQRGFVDHSFEHSRGMVTDAPSLAPVGQPVTIRSDGSDHD